jgi:hypothetical protein
MNENRYKQIISSSDYQIFSFISEGRYGKLTKVVRFDKLLNYDNTYNLALGTVLNNGEVDYQIITNNGDRNKLLATVAFIAVLFTENNPGYSIYISGSDARRTTLYHRAISYGYKELIEIFNIYGDLSSEDEVTDLEPFDPEKSYSAFVVEKK